MNNLTDFIWEILEESDLEYEGQMYCLVEDTGWVGEHKGESRDIIVGAPQENGGLKHFRLTQYRTGSHYTDWHYDSIDRMVEVEPETVSKIVWKEVK